MSNAVSVIGVDRVGLGGDFLQQIARATGDRKQTFEGIAVNATLDGLEGPRGYLRLLEALGARGYSARTSLPSRAATSFASSPQALSRSLQP